MDKIIISVVDKIATNVTPGNIIICGNGDYTITFEFDEEWEKHPDRVARFIYECNGRSCFQDVAFTGRVVTVPVLSNLDLVQVGVYSGDLCTTTAAKIVCGRSIRCGDTQEALPEEYGESLQAQIGNLGSLETENKGSLVAAINEAAKSGGGNGGPTKSGGYYKPSVAQPGDNTVTISFTPSEAGLPSVDPITVNLPAGKNGDNGETPYIGPNGNWHLAGTDTGVKAKGEDGKNAVTPKISAVKSGKTTTIFVDGRAVAAVNDGADAENPVKGVDYWTAADKQEIVKALEEGIPLVKTAEPPTFVSDISQCVDASKVYVLPNGYLAAYVTKQTAVEGSTTPNFTNLFDKSKGAYVKEGYRWSSSGAAWAACATDACIIVPVTVPAVYQEMTFRIRGATFDGAAYGKKVWQSKTTNDVLTLDGLYSATYATESNGDLTIKCKSNYADLKYMGFSVAANVDASALVVTLDEEISYNTTPGSSEAVSAWTDLGIEYNQPPDYSSRVSALESKTSNLRADVDSLAGKATGGSSGDFSAFSFKAYPPTPQLPGDGSDEADFDVSNVLTSQVYGYMDDLWARHYTYVTKQNLGKDSSGKYDYYRYVFSKAYWRAWYQEDHPLMFAWKNGDNVIYSASVSPRVGDTMYSTTYVGEAYGTVAAVNCETIGIASTRTVNGMEFTRYTAGDVEPTIVYTVPFAITASYKGRTYTAGFAGSHSVQEYTHEYIVDSKGTKFLRYPFLDKKLDKSPLFSVFILANEHGNHGDSMIPCVTVLRMLKDLCSPTNNLFLQWLKENAVLTVIPLGNPHGSYNNANRVNINRNYDTPGWAGSNDDPQGGTKAEGAFGPYAGSEIETQYIMNTIQQCKPKTAMSCHGRGIPSGTLNGPYNSAAHFQGCGFSAERMWRVEEALFSMYNFGFTPSHHTITDDSSNNYLNAGKSPSYIEYAGAVGGLIEIDDFEVGSLNLYTPLAMEQAYAEVLLVLQNWVEEALQKEGER